MKHRPDPEHEELHRRAQLEHIQAEISRTEGVRDQLPENHRLRKEAERYLASLHERLERGIKLDAASPLIGTTRMMARQAE